MENNKLNKHLQQGKRAEEQASQFLQRKGLQVIEQNFSCYHGEIDLIMRDKEHVVFVEVRFRARTDYGHALQSVDKWKIKKLIKTATHFLQKKDWLYKVNSRFDIITIQLHDSELQLEWIKNAFTV